MSKILIVGGGAAGMMAAVAAAENGHTVELYEKNEKLGKKIYITGKGRCNVTNACDWENFFENIVSNSKFMFSSFGAWNNFDVMDWLEAKGLRLKTERGNRVFPESDHSSDVIKVFQKELEHLDVRVHLRTAVQELIVEDGVCQGLILASGLRVSGDAVIVATGGLSYPSTGSTGDGYRWAEGAGHKITELSPALVPFNAVFRDGRPVKEVQGLALKNISVTLWHGQKRLTEAFGEMLFTHFGVSGPVLLSASSLVTKVIKKGPLTLELDWKPALSEEQLDARLLRDFEAAKNKNLKNVMGGLLPSTAVPLVIRYTGISPEKKIHEITREERGRIVHEMKHFLITLTGLRDYNEAIITQGGISVKEIQPATMESKKVKKLYFAGEVLDVDALTGGYNLQVAWSTGYAAGKAVE